MDRKERECDRYNSCRLTPVFAALSSPLLLSRRAPSPTLSMSHPPPPPHPATGGGGGVIAAVIENRAGEVGAAFYDGDRVR